MSLLGGCPPDLTSNHGLAAIRDPHMLNDNGLTAAIAEAMQQRMPVLEGTGHPGHCACGSAHLDIEVLERVPIDHALQSVRLFVEAPPELHDAAVHKRHLMRQHAFK